MSWTYISPEDYRKAAELGISELQVYNRVLINGWSVERAISTPMRRHYWSGWNEVKDLAEKNGICYETFISRRKMGWDVEKASTEPPLLGRRLSGR